MSSVKVTVYGRVKPCPENTNTQEYRLKFGTDEDYITFTNLKGATGRKSYRFHKLFTEEATQEDVFETVAKPIIEKVLSGFNGTIFTYGQTGSGKTYTMTGDIETWIKPGLIPQTIQEIFQTKKDDVTVSITYCEIYNEHVYDLIRTERMDSEIPQVSLMEDGSGITHFRNLSVHNVSSSYEALQLLIKGDANKMVAETMSNPKSSRSHVIFSINLDIPHPNQESLCLKPILYLVDLAGSEKLTKSKVQMSNVWETRYINLSLHYLEQVLIALRQPGRAHIPYRNSLMTALLRNSLGGNCVTAMIATFSLALEDTDETLHTCRFAERIALIKNDVKINEIFNPEKEIEKLRKENEKLRAQVKINNRHPCLELSKQEKEICHHMVQSFIESNNSEELPIGDARQIEFCCHLLRDEIIKHIGIAKGNLKIAAASLVANKDTSKVIKRELDKEAQKIFPVNFINRVESNIRRKRSPVDLPKVNITFKRWKSTEKIQELESSDSDEKRENFVNKTILTHPSNDDFESSKNLCRCLTVNKVPNDEVEPLNLYGVQCDLRKVENFLLRQHDKQDQTNKDFQIDEKSISVGTYDTASVRSEVNPPPSPLKNQNEKKGSGERFSSAKMKDVVSVGVQIDHDIEDEDVSSEAEIALHKAPNSDDVSMVSSVSSDFSCSRLPLTGDAEIDEEILRFYKTRYKIFKNQGSRPMPKDG